MVLAAMIQKNSRPIQFIPMLGTLRDRTRGLILLGAAFLMAACGGDSSAGPRDEDRETVESRLSRPERVSDLAVESAGANSVVLRFTEVSDGINPTRPASYEIRHTPTPMRNGWNTAKVVSRGTCAAPIVGTQVGATRSCTVEGLDASTSYDFQMVAFRLQGKNATYGQLSGVVTGVTNAGGGVSALFKMEGDNQTGVVGTALPEPLAVKVKDEFGNGLAGVRVSWSANGGGGSVSSTTTTSDSDGYARVTRTLGTVRGEHRTTAYVSGAAPVEFRAMADPGPVTTVTVLPAEVSLSVGDSTDMVALLEDQYGNRVNGPSVTWSSSDASIADIRSSGRVLARKRGVAGVTASVDGAISTSGSTGPQAAAAGGSTVRVLDESSTTPGALAAVAGSGQTGTVGTALAQPFVVEVRSAAGDLLSGVTVNWQVTNGGGAVAGSSSVTGSNGRAQTTLTLGTVAGTNGVRASVEGVGPVDFTAQAQAGALASITVTPGSTSVAVGGTVQFSAALRDQYGNQVEGTPAWSSTSTSVSTVNGSGIASGVSAGSTTIRAAFGGRLGQASLTVTTTASANPGTVSDLAVVGSTASSLTLRFTSVNDGSGNPANYQIRYATTPLGWGWGQATPVASGSCAGVVSSSSVGQQVTCTAEGLPSGASLDFQMVAYRGNLGSTAVFGNLSNIATGQTGASSPTGTGTLAISPRGGTLTAIGATLQLSATARDGSGATISNPGITWSSSNTNVATVDGAGRVTARGLGSAIISVAAACCSGDQVQVTVTQQISSISVSPSSASVTVGQSTQLSAVARDANGNLIPNVLFAWSSSSASIAQVNGTGLVSGVAAGSSTVSASAGGRSGSAAISVASASEPPPPSGGGSGTWPNEPAGFRVVTDNPFASRNYTGWQPNNRQATVTISSDSSAPFSGSTVLQANFPAGFPDGHEPGVDYVPVGSGMREGYIGYWVRSNPEWQVNPYPDSYAGVKSTFLWFGTGGYMFMGWGQWAGLSSLEPVIQGSGARTFETTTGVHRTANYIRPGQWHQVEIYFRTNDSGQQNGILRWWVNGRLIGSYTNAVFPGSTLQAFSIDNTLGGGGQNKSQNDWIRYAHVRISRP